MINFWKSLLFIYQLLLFITKKKNADISWNLILANILIYHCLFYESLEESYYVQRRNYKLLEKITVKLSFSNIYCNARIMLTFYGI